MSSIYDKASLVLIPSGTKTSKVYSQKPTNGDGDFTFSRSTAATRVNASGNIEKETQNLLLRSNTFSGAVWVLTNSPTITGGQAGYDGTNDAWKLEATTTGSSRSIHQIVSSSGVQVFSVYVKAGTTSWIRLNLSGIGNRYFDIGNGVVGGSGSMDGFITDVGGGWYRCSVLGNGSSTAPYIFLASGDGNLAVSAGDNIYIQDAQLEQGLVARSYNETTTSAFEGGITDNVPRLDYTDSSCPALLLEPQRTNLVNHSEYFGDSSWSKTSAGGGSNAVVTDNYGVSPEGLQNAARLQLNLNGGTSASDISYIAYYYAATGVATTNSVYMKSLSGTTNVRIRCGSTFESVDVTTDWQRFDVTDSSTSDRFQVLIYGGINSDTADLLIWGAQGEAGSYATSYIPTYGSAVTREGDRCINTSATSIVGQTQGSIFLEYDNTNTDSSGGQVRASIHSSGFTDWIFLGEESGNYRMYFRVNGSVLLNNQAAPANGTNKICIAYNESGDIRMFFNGSKVGTYSTAFTFNGTLNTIEFGNGGWNVSSSNAFKQYDIFPTALTDQEAIALTTI